MRFRAYPILVAMLAVGCAPATDEATTESAISLEATPDAIREFTETYDCGTMDVGHWLLSTNDLRARVIEPSGGHPGGYLYSEVSSPIPTWSTVSPRVEQGSGGDTIFVGDYYASRIHRISADMRVYQAGSWSASRTVTLQLMRWDVTNDTVAVQATYSRPDIPEVPKGWHHYEFQVDAQSPTIPPGWALERGDGTPGTDADWVALMHQVDIVSFGYWKLGYMYPALGLWKLGIDNIHIGAW
jgi:hypothetical protein